MVVDAMATRNEVQTKSLTYAGRRQGEKIRGTGIYVYVAFFQVDHAATISPQSPEIAKNGPIR